MYVSSGGVHQHTGKTHQGSSNPRDILQKLDLSRIQEWKPQLQQEALDLIYEFACIFSQNHLDLYKTSIAFHLECMMKLKHTSRKC